MKKITALLLALMMLAGVLAGCGKPQDTGKAGKLKVVTTIFPEYDWVRAILGDKADNAEITMLLDNGVDLHSYQPTADAQQRLKYRRNDVEHAIREAVAQVLEAQVQAA